MCRTVSSSRNAADCRISGGTEHGEANEQSSMACKTVTLEPKRVAISAPTSSARVEAAPKSVATRTSSIGVILSGGSHRPCRRSRRREAGGGIAGFSLRRMICVQRNDIGARPGTGPCAACALLGVRIVSAFTHVLVATDFGKPAESAEALGISFAEKFGAKLTVLYVFSVPNAAYATGSYLQIDQLERQARKALEAKTAALKQRFPQLTAVMRTGTPYEEILATAKEAGADLIVMGTHGRRGVPRALLGSVAERVVRTAAVPVLTVSASPPEPAKSPAEMAENK